MDYPYYGVYTFNQYGDILEEIERVKTENEALAVCETSPEEEGIKYDYKYVPNRQEEVYVERMFYDYDWEHDCC